MTRHKSFKRLVRSRMEKTGESYTAARAALLAAQPFTDTPAPPLALTARSRAGLPTSSGSSRWSGRPRPSPSATSAPAACVPWASAPTGSR